MGDPFSLATGVLSVVGLVLQLASGAMAMVDKTVTAHDTQQLVIRNLRHELDKTIKSSACMQIALKAILGNSKDKIVKRMCKKCVLFKVTPLTPDELISVTSTKCIIALQELTKALETTQACIEQWVNDENSAPIDPHNALPSNRKSLEFIQAVFKHDVSQSAIDDAIEAVEELQSEVAKYRENAEIAFQHLLVLYNVQNFRALQGHANVESLPSVSTRVSVRTVESISNRISECSAQYMEGDGELDPIQWLLEQASQANLHSSPISSQVLSIYEGEDAISEDGRSVRVGLSKNPTFTEIMVHRTPHQLIQSKVQRKIKCLLPQCWSKHLEHQTQMTQVTLPPSITLPQSKLYLSTTNYR